MKQIDISIEQILGLASAELLARRARVLHRCLMDSVQVENFCLVGLLVIHGVPQTGLVADEVIPVAPIVRDMCAMMKRIGLGSKLKGANFKGPTWFDEKNAIYNFLANCEWMMLNATMTRLAPELNEVPGTRLAPMLAPLAMAGLDSDDYDEEDDDYQDEEDDDYRGDEEEEEEDDDEDEPPPLLPLLPPTSYEEEEAKDDDDDELPPLLPLTGDKEEEDKHDDEVPPLLPRTGDVEEEDKHADEEVDKEDKEEEEEDKHDDEEVDKDEDASFLLLLD